MAQRVTDVRIDPGKTWLPLATVVAVVCGLVAFVWNASEWRNAIKNNTKAIESLTTAVESTWTAKDMERWTKTFRALNPTLNVPDPIR